MARRDDYGSGADQSPISAKPSSAPSATYDAAYSELRVGDVVSVTGFPWRTKRGELSLVPREVRLLAPCLHTLPASLEAHLRRQLTHVDLLVNERRGDVLRARAKVIGHVRGYLEAEEFVHVETPVGWTGVVRCGAV